jgi:hypothetical protein
MHQEQKDHIIKLFIGLLLAVLTFIVVKKYIIPILPELSLSNVLALPMSNLLKIFETAAVIILLAGFVVQELFDFFATVLQKHKHSVDNSTRWNNLAYLFALVFGSASLYAAVVNIAGW